jgi:diguanylate cyclase
MNEGPHPRTLAARTAARLVTPPFSVAFLALVYFAGAVLGLALARPPFSIAGIWIANALALSIVLRQDLRAWPLSLGAVVLASLAANLTMGTQLDSAFGFAVANLVEVAVAAVLIRRWLGPTSAFVKGLANYGRIQLIAAVAAPAIGATIGASVAYMTSDAPPWAIGWSWWSGSALGAVVVLPVTLMATGELIRRTFRRPEVTEFLALAALSVLAMGLAVTFLRFPFVLFSVPLAIAAFRINPFATAVIVALSIATVIILHFAGVVPDLRQPGSVINDSVAFFAALAMLMP